MRSGGPRHARTHGQRRESRQRHRQRSITMRQRKGPVSVPEPPTHTHTGAWLQCKCLSQCQVPTSVHVPRPPSQCHCLSQCQVPTPMPVPRPCPNASTCPSARSSPQCQCHCHIPVPACPSSQPRQAVWVGMSSQHSATSTCTAAHATPWANCRVPSGPPHRQLTHALITHGCWGQHRATNMQHGQSCAAARNMPL